MIVLDGPAFEEIKTKTWRRCSRPQGPGRKVLFIVLPEKDEKPSAPCATSPGVKTALVNTLNVYEVLNADKFIVVKDAVAKIEEVYK